MARVTCVLLIFTWMVPVGLGARVSRGKIRTGGRCPGRINPEGNRRALENTMSVYFANFCTRQFLISTT